MKKLKSQNNIGYLYLLPAVILMGVFIIYSMILNVQISMTDWSGLSEKHFIAFANYVKLFRDKAFWDSLGVQLIWMLLSTVFHALGGLILSIIVEYFIHRKLQAVFRTLFFMPMMMSLVAVGILWTLIYNPLIGVINEILQVLGILSGNQTLDLLGDRSTALLAAFIPALWQWSGFGMVASPPRCRECQGSCWRRHRSTAAANGSRSAISSSPCCARRSSPSARST